MTYAGAFLEHRLNGLESYKKYLDGRNQSDYESAQEQAKEAERERQRVIAAYKVARNHASTLAAKRAEAQISASQKGHPETADKASKDRESSRISTDADVVKVTTDAALDLRASADSPTLSSPLKDESGDVRPSREWEPDPDEIEELEEDAHDRVRGTVSKRDIIQILIWPQVDGRDKGGYMLEIVYRTKTSATNSLTRHAILKDAQKLIKDLSRDHELDKIAIYMLRPHVRMKDVYGKSSEDGVAKIVLRRDAARQIEWGDMIPERFERLLNSVGTIWWHPAVQ